MTRHLDAQRWQSPDAELLAHLERDECEVCDAFLASLAGVDGQVDALLLGLARRPASSDELAWARFKRRRAEAEAGTAPVAATPPGSLSGSAPPGGEEQRARSAGASAEHPPGAAARGELRAAASAGQGGLAAGRRRWLAAAGVLLAGAAALALGWRDDVSQWTGLKGSDGPASVQLRAVLKVPGEADLSPLPGGATVPSSGALVFRADSSVAGPARLFVQRGDGAVEELTQLELKGGAQEFDGRGRGELLGFSLSGERGRVTLYLVAAERPFSAEEARAAIAGGGASSLAVSKLEVDVAP